MLHSDVRKTAAHGCAMLDVAAAEFANDSLSGRREDRWKTENKVETSFVLASKLPVDHVRKFGAGSQNDRFSLTTTSALGGFAEPKQRRHRDADRRIRALLQSPQNLVGGMVVGVADVS